MQVTLQELMEKLGVGHILSPYETAPWAISDTESGQTFSAEIRMSPDSTEVEAEIQIVRDHHEDGQLPVEQLMWMIMTPHIQDKWSVKTLRIKNENWNNKVYGWEEKSCNLFRAVTTEITLGNFPDFDELLDREMLSKERFGDQRGGGGGKSPKIRPGQLLNMKTGF